MMILASFCYNIPYNLSGFETQVYDFKINSKKIQTNVLSGVSNWDGLFSSQRLKRV